MTHLPALAFTIGNFLVYLLGLSPLSAAETTGTVLREQLDHVATAAEANGFNGSIDIEIDGRTILNKGYGWTAPDRRRRVDVNTLFNIASVSKAITATAIMKLADAGKLDIHQSIATIFAGVPPDKTGITIEELLIHASCLPDQYAANGLASRDVAVAAIVALPLLCQPGIGFNYSDDGYALLAAVIEIISRERYADFVRHEVFGPAGMRNSKFWDEVDDRTTPNVARIVTLPLQDRLRGLNWGYIGSGGIWSTAEDLVRYFKALRSGKIVSLHAEAQMFEPRTKVSVGSVGYGWYLGRSLKDTPLVFARGNEDWGHSALIFWYPEQHILLAIVTNAGFDHDTPVSRTLARSLEEVLLCSTD